MRVLITGGAGKVAALLRTRLTGHTLRLFDIREPDPVAAGGPEVADRRAATSGGPEAAGRGPRTGRTEVADSRGPRTDPGQAADDRGPRADRKAEADERGPTTGRTEVADSRGPRADHRAQADDRGPRADHRAEADRRAETDGRTAAGGGVEEVEEVVLGSVDDPDAVARACAGVDAVVHLGGLAKEAAFEDVLRVNAYGTWCVLEGARRAGARVVLASSTHAAGFTDSRDAPPGGLPADTPPRPDTMYGWSKVAGEAAARLYVDRFGMDVVCLRIGMWVGTPPGLRGLAMWLSPDDGARLVRAALTVPSPGFRTVWGISRNTRRYCSLTEGEAIGYFPQDDAETYAPDLIAKHGEPDFAGIPELYRLGGAWCEIPLGRPPTPR